MDIGNKIFYYRVIKEVMIMGISNLLTVIYVILIILFVVKAVGASNIGGKSKSYGGKTQQRTFNRSFESKYFKDKPKNTTAPKMRSSDSYIDKERKKEKKSVFKNIFGPKDVDCDLDERIFGPKNQHKDIF